MPQQPGASPEFTGTSKPDRRRPLDHIGQFNFVVELEGIQIASFKSVSGLQSEVETIEHREGTDPHTRKLPGRVKVSNIVLKRGYADRHMTDLWNWYNSVLKGKTERRSGSIVLLNNSGHEVCRYNFFEAWPCRWKGWDLEGTGNETAIEELELCVEHIERDPNQNPSEPIFRGHR